MRKTVKAIIKHGNKKMVKSPLLKKSRLELKKLVSRIYSKNRYPEIKFGKPIGKEII